MVRPNPRDGQEIARLRKRPFEDLDIDLVSNQTDEPVRLTPQSREHRGGLRCLSVRRKPAPFRQRFHGGRREEPAQWSSAPESSLLSRSGAVFDSRRLHSSVRRARALAPKS